MANDTLPLGGVYLAPTRNPFNYEKFEQIDRDIATRWLSSADIDNQLNLFGDTSQDSYLTGLELAVRMAIEDYLGMPIFSQSYRVYYGAGSLYGTPLALDLPEVSQSGVTITSVKYYDNSSPTVLITLDPSTYYYDPTGNKIVLNTMPNNVNNFMTNPVVATYSLTASSLASYPVIKQAGLLLLTHLYNNRSDTTSTGLQTIPFGVDVLLRPYKDLVM